MAESDDLARTATAAAGAGGAAPLLGDTLGRYRLERMLGEGGMGVVHAAFDPDLERRVALKVLRTADGSDQARQRLLREARAMARLTHANVVTVHEVGSASGRDYVAMELIDGESLDQWLRAQRRSPREIVDAFVAAGRGLAAAHAAGLVHRDFKPHNVLRRRDGRICVTDFGLARGVENQVAFDKTLDVKAATPVVTPSALAELTATGSVLGTPAYMAPEQWSGGTVGPAADQFAFCVAMWEALSGERPFRGATIDALKAEVLRGGTALDASKLPRNLRVALRQGLDPDPAKRWPSMDALLAAIARAERPRKVALYLGGVGVLAAAGVYAAFGHGSGAPACEAPAADPAIVWPASEAAALRAAGRGAIADALDRDVTDWIAVRGRACQAPTDKRVAELACLDGVLARLDAVHRTVTKMQGELKWDDVVGRLVAPSVCEAAVPPRLATKATPDVVTALGYSIQADPEDGKLSASEVSAFAGKQGLDPCARTIALGALADLLDVKDKPTSRTARTDAITAADQCGDDRARADAAIAEAPNEFEVPVYGPRAEAAVLKANTAAARVAQPDLVAQIDELRANILTNHQHYDEAFKAIDKAIEEYGQRHRPVAQIDEVVHGTRLRGERANLEDLSATRAAVAKWRPVAEQLHDQHLVDKLDRSDAIARWFSGDSESGQRDLMRLWKPVHFEGMPAEHIDGVVVGEDGKPVAGATVVSGQFAFFDSHGPLPLPGMTYSMRMTKTDDRGTFEIPDAVPGQATVVAELGELRSLPVVQASHVKLALVPVRRISGTADLAGRDRTEAFVMLAAGGPGVSYRVVAPIQADGTFTIDRAPTTGVGLGIATRDGLDRGTIEMTSIPASRGPTTGVALKVNTSERVLDVIARSTTTQPLDTAQLCLLDGHVTLKSVDELNEHARAGNVKVAFAAPPIGEKVPASLLDKMKPGDLVAHLQRVPAGDLTLCAIGFQGDFQDPKFASRLQSHIHDLTMKCEWLGGTDATVVVEAPPQKRFD